MKNLVLLITSVLLASCGVNPNDAERVLKAQGMKDVKIGGYAIWGCASGKNGDSFASSFSATAQDGSKVTGVICSGLLKGYTVRYD